jgi:hypothetical protein
MEMQIPDSGFVVRVVRQRVERRLPLGPTRTVGEYECFWRGKSLPELKGQIVESGGPGNNTDEIGDLNNRRIEEGIYRLAIHLTSKYRTFSYSHSNETKAKPRPAVALADTAEREGILIHPSSGYLWSEGCLNPCSALLNADSNIDYRDSRQRVIRIIDAISTALGPRMPKNPEQLIPDACVVIEGEPA